MFAEPRFGLLIWKLEECFRRLYAFELGVNRFNALQALDSSTSRYLRSFLLQNGATNLSLQRLRWQPHHLPWALLAGQLVAMQRRQCLQSRVAQCCRSTCLKGLCSTWGVAYSSFLLPPPLLILLEVCENALDTAW